MTSNRDVRKQSSIINRMLRWTLARIASSRQMIVYVLTGGTGAQTT